MPTVVWSLSWNLWRWRYKILLAGCPKWLLGTWTRILSENSKLWITYWITVTLPLNPLYNSAKPLKVLWCVCLFHKWKRVLVWLKAWHYLNMSMQTWSQSRFWYYKHANESFVRKEKYVKGRLYGFNEILWMPAWKWYNHVKLNL